jgi:hypothetical protein
MAFRIVQAISNHKESSSYVLLHLRKSAQSVDKISPDNPQIRADLFHCVFSSMVIILSIVMRRTIL